MFETYGAAWSEMKRWWRDTPVGLKILTPFGLVILMLLPFEIGSLGELSGNAETRNEPSDPRFPKDFGPEGDGPPA